MDEVRGLTARRQAAGRNHLGGRRARRSAIAKRSSFWRAKSIAMQMLTQMQVRTRRFAKRQGTWFRSLSECRFVDVAGELDARPSPSGSWHGHGTTLRPSMATVRLEGDRRLAGSSSRVDGSRQRIVFEGEEGDTGDGTGIAVWRRRIRISRLLASCRARSARIVKELCCSESEQI